MYTYICVYFHFLLGVQSHYQLLCVAMLWRREQSTILLPPFHLQLYLPPSAHWARVGHKNTKSQDFNSQQLQIYHCNNVCIQSCGGGDDTSDIFVWQPSKLE